MPYTKSYARKEFDEAVNDFYTQARFVSLKKNSIPNDIQQCVFRNAIFQSSAALEEFIRSVLEDWIRSLSLNNKVLSDIPDELRFWSIGKCQKNIFTEYSAKNNEADLVKKLMSSAKLSSLFDPSTKVSDVIHHAEHVSDKKYPSIKNLNILFKRFGIADFFSSVNVKGKKNYKSILQSFSDIRTSIAHQYPTPVLLFADISQQIKSICNFVATIDKVMYQHVVQHSGHVCWKTTML